MSAGRFENWLLLKTITICEVFFSGMSFMCMLDEINGMGRVVPIIAYALVSIALMWTAYYSFNGAHKHYDGFYRPKKD